MCEVSADCGSSWSPCHRAGCHQCHRPQPSSFPLPGRETQGWEKAAGSCFPGCRSFWIWPWQWGHCGDTQGQLHALSWGSGRGLHGAGDSSQAVPGRNARLAYQQGSLPGPAPHWVMANYLLIGSSESPGKAVEPQIDGVHPKVPHARMLCSLQTTTVKAAQVSGGTKSLSLSPNPSRDGKLSSC